MDIKWVEDFLALVEHGSFTKAAEARHVTQSGFSRRIRSLECSLGVDLVKRNVFPTTLTKAGEQNIESMKLLLNQYFDLQRKIEENGKKNKMILLTTQHALSICFFPKWYHDKQLSEQSLNIKVLANDFHDCLVSFLAGQSDLLLCYYSQDICLELSRSDIICQEVGLDHLIPVVLSDSDLFNTDAHPSGIPLISYPAETFFGQLLEQQVMGEISSTFVFDAVIETAMSDSVKSLVLQGIGMGWLPKAMVEKELQSGELRQVSGIPHLAMRVMLYKHKLPSNEVLNNPCLNF